MRYTVFPAAVRYLRCLLFLCVLFFAAAALRGDVEFEVVDSSRSAAQHSVSSPASTQQMEITELSDSDDSDAEFIIVSKEEKKALLKKQETVIEDPNFEVIRKAVPPGPEELRAEYEKKKKEYDSLISEKSRARTFLFFSYHPLNNTINGLDARAFITLFILSLVTVISMFWVLLKEYERTPPVYSGEQMEELRNSNPISVSPDDASAYVNALWHRAAAGAAVKDDEYLPIDSRGDLHILHRELLMTAAALPTDSASVNKLNRIADAICFWRKRYLIAPGVSIDSGIFKRIIMGIVYAALLIIYVRHPMYLLVICAPLAFLTPAYLVDKREDSFVYKMLGGSLKIFGKITGNAFEGAANMEGATVTVYKSSYGNTAYVEHNYWGVLIVFAIKIAFALFLLYLIYFFAPAIILYAVIRNYILAK